MVAEETKRRRRRRRSLIRRRQRSCRFCYGEGCRRKPWRRHATRLLFPSGTRGLIRCGRHQREWVWI